MKIVVFAPHPDDEIYGTGGSILKWMKEGHNIHIVYVTDNRALITWGKKNNQILIEEAQDYINLSEDQIGEIGLKEAKSVAKAFGFPNDKVHLFEFHDQDALNQMSRGITLAKTIIYDADRIVIPSDNNNHPDHQATHTIAKEAAIELNLVNTEFYVYAIYNVMKAPMEKQVKIRIAEYRDQIYNIMALYKTQLVLKDTRMGWLTLKRKRSERFGVFNLSNAGKFYNF
ncbi:MAG TPA: PIG-L family deacetylase [Candidatus Nanopelagicaceae bacterium]|nr:PIG-L family deacetylase [Candidatus Nanopelagicaceae bacterium]